MRWTVYNPTLTKILAVGTSKQMPDEREVERAVMAAEIQRAAVSAEARRIVKLARERKH